MTSFGLAEIGIVVLLILISFDIKQIGKILKWLRNIRTKFYRMQSDLKYQFNNLVAEEERKDELDKIQNSSDEMRKWGAKQARSFTTVRKFEASKSLLTVMEDFEPFKKAEIIAAYSSLHDELDTSQLLKKILADGKTLLLPYVKDKHMLFARICELGKDTVPGPFGILEPVEKYREEAAPSPDIFLIPGRCFDEHGGRIGRGKGYYDRYLIANKGARIGLCYNAQISTKKLSLSDLDQKMDYIVTEKRIIDAKESLHTS
jgi:5-formyltetrahydrofolate cyclo-ligase